MRYVDDLTKVKPEEIEHIKGKTGIFKIISVPAPTDDCEVVVVYEDGDSCSYTKDGRYFRDKERLFAYKPKKRLKTLAELVKDYPDMWVTYDGGLHSTQWIRPMPLDIARTLQQSEQNIEEYIDEWLTEE